MCGESVCVCSGVGGLFIVRDSNLFNFGLDVFVMLVFWYGYVVGDF